MFCLHFLLLMHVSLNSNLDSALLHQIVLLRALVTACDSNCGTLQYSPCLMSQQHLTGCSHSASQNTFGPWSRTLLFPGIPPISDHSHVVTSIGVPQL